MIEKEIEITAATDFNYLERKNIQLRGEIQCLNDRIAGLVKENENLRIEAKIHRAISMIVGRIKSIWNSFTMFYKESRE